MDRNSARKYAKRNEPLPSKYMRKATWRLMIRALLGEVTRFIEGRLRELKISEARYEDLLSEANGNYPKCLNSISSSIYI